MIQHNYDNSILQGVTVTRNRSRLLTAKIVKNVTVTVTAEKILKTYAFNFFANLKSSKNID